jgi:hypothetical protein
MNLLNKVTIVAAVAMVLSPAAAYAHHSHANLDGDNIQVHSGIITEYRWAMPHVFVKIKSPNPEGEVVEYVLELVHPPAMVARGWSPDTLKVGDHVTWEGSTDRNPTRYFSGMDWIEKDGVRISYATDDKKGVAATITPSTDFTGLWRRSSSVDWTYAPPEGMPLTAVGQELVDSYDPRDNPQADCRDPGPPRYTILPYPIQITRPDDVRIVMEGELRQDARTVYLDRDHPAGPPSQLGHSVGWYEGDELVVETTNFIEDEWGTRAGLDSSNQKHLLERYSLSDDGMSLKLFMTVTDPVYLTESMDIDHSMDKQIDRKLVRAPCSKEGAAMFISGIVRGEVEE